MTNFELKSEGLRLASLNESGWYYKIVNEGEIETLWVTECDPLPSSVINWTNEEPRPFVEHIQTTPLIKFGVHPRQGLGLDSEYTDAGVERRNGLYRTSQLWEVFEDLTDTELDQCLAVMSAHGHVVEYDGEDDLWVDRFAADQLRDLWWRNYGQHK